MKKYFSLIICVLVSLFAFNVSASAQSTMTNLVDAVSEEIGYFGNRSNFESDSSFDAYQEYVNKMKSADLSNYSESDSKVNVYIFRGKTCWHCLDEISWFAEHYSEVAPYVNIHTYEVWNNTTNNNLMSMVAKKLGTKASGVPFTVVGDKTFSGFGEETGTQILEQAQAILNSDNKYDIKDDIDLENVALKNEDKKSSTAIIVVLIITVVCGGAALIYLVSKSN